MTTLNRVVVEWQGASIVGRAVSVLHFSGSDSAPSSSAILAAYQALHAHIPAGVTITIPNTGDQIDDTTGTLSGTWTSTGGGVATMDGVGNCARGAGGVVSWTTGGIVRGKRLRGRTFVVPLVEGAYSPNGVLGGGALTALGAFANGLQASGPMAVWHRPTTKGGSDGNSYGVISNKVSGKVAWLSSRRD